VKSGGVKVTIAFAMETDDGISTAWHFTGPIEVIKKRFAAWPLNFDKTSDVIEHPIDVEAKLDIATVTAGSQVNAIANEVAKEKKKKSGKGKGKKSSEESEESDELNGSEMEGAADAAEELNEQDPAAPGKQKDLIESLARQIDDLET